MWRYGGAAAELNGSPSLSLDSVYVGSNDDKLHAVAPSKLLEAECGQSCGASRAEWIYATGG